MAKSVVHESASNNIDNTEFGSDYLEDLPQGPQTNQNNLDANVAEENVPNRMHLPEVPTQMISDRIEPLVSFSSREALYNMVSSFSIVWNMTYLLKLIRIQLISTA
jgi:hypothetical protein